MIYRLLVDGRTLRVGTGFFFYGDNRREVSIIENDGVESVRRPRATTVANVDGGHMNPTREVVYKRSVIFTKGVDEKLLRGVL